MIKKYKCDQCGKKCKIKLTRTKFRLEELRCYYSASGFSKEFSVEFDLCENCSTKLIDWIRKKDKLPE